MTAPLSIFLVFANSFLGILGILLAMVATGISYRPTHEALQIELTPREKRPALFAIYDVLTNLSTSAGTMIGAVLFTISYTVPFYGFTAIEAAAVVILALSFFTKKGKRRFATITP
jgi:predicted MFS family arabinose efflux permease